MLSCEIFFILKFDWSKKLFPELFRSMLLQPNYLKLRIGAIKLLHILVNGQGSAQLRQRYSRTLYNGHTGDRVYWPL